MKFCIRAGCCCSFSYGIQYGGGAALAIVVNLRRLLPRGADRVTQITESTQYAPYKATVNRGATALTPQIKVFTRG